MTVFLQGAAGDALPLESFRDDDGRARSRPTVFGERLALEAAHAIADADPWAVEIDRSDWGSVTPISLYRRRLAAEQPPQVLRTARRIVSLPLLDLPSVADLGAELAERRADLAARGRPGETRVTMNPIRYHISWLETMLAQEAAGGRRDRHRRRDLGGAARRLRDRRGAGRDLRGDRHGRPRGARRPRSRSSRATARAASATSRRPTSTRTAATSRRSRTAATASRPRSRPTVAGIIEETAVELLTELFA